MPSVLSDLSWFIFFSKEIPGELFKSEIFGDIKLGKDLKKLFSVKPLEVLQKI